jgi:hypothetical protein
LDEVETVMANLYHPSPSDEDSDQSDLVRQGVMDVALIEANFNRIANTMKVSAPLKQQVLAKVLQTIQVNAVEFPAADYINKVAAPTTQQVQEQFDKYANVAAPEQLDPQNPYRFGYRLPDRVKVQYITIDRSQAEKAIERQKSAYDWEVQARRYYLGHKDEYPSTAPSTAPSTTQEASAASQPTTAPAYLPYEKVADQALHAVRDPLVEKLMFDVGNKVLSTMTADWRNYQQPGAAGATTAPTTAATASGYPSYAYLKTLTDAIQKQFDVTIYLADYDREQSYNDLKALLGIGPASDAPAARGGRNFADLAMTRAKSWLGRPDKDTPAAQAQLMQPMGLRASRGEDTVPNQAIQQQSLRPPTAGFGTRHQFERPRSQRFRGAGIHLIGPVRPDVEPDTNEDDHAAGRRQGVRRAADQSEAKLGREHLLQSGPFGHVPDAPIDGGRPSLRLLQLRLGRQATELRTRRRPKDRLGERLTDTDRPNAAMLA